MGDKRDYYNIIIALWQMFKNDLALVDGITDPQDKAWDDLCDRYEKIYDDAPESVKDYADSMIKVHIAELEKRWRWKKQM